MNNYIVHDSQNEKYRFPFGAVEEDTKVTLRIKLESDWIVFLEVSYFDGSNETIKMDKNHDLSSYKENFYETLIDTKEHLGLINYYFRILQDHGEVFYGNNYDGLGGIGVVCNRYDIKPYQITVYKESKVPAWYKDGVVYQIFVDRFNNGNKNKEIYNKKKNSFIYANWDDQPCYIRDKEGRIIRWDFYGGNLKGVINKLDYLKELGITIIYLNPIFEATSNHKYDTGDYEKIDPMFGDEEDFKELCIKAKDLGIRIILDGVFSHTGSDSKYFNKFGNYKELGAYQSRESKYYPWYTFNDYPYDYKSWWGIDTEPEVNELNPSYLDYIVTGKNSIVSKWINLGASGFRLDVADELPDKFIALLKERIKTEKKDSVLIGEVWEDASNKISYSKRREYLFGEELDSTTNYPFRGALISFLKGEITSERFRKIIMSLYENYPSENFYGAMNILGNHDTERIKTALNSDINLLKDAILIQMTMPGVPLIYYGDEAGLEGSTDPYNRGPYPWRNENKEIQNHYKKLISFRNEMKVLKEGKLTICKSNEDVLAFKRYDEKYEILVIVNRSQEKRILEGKGFAKGEFYNYLNNDEIYNFNDEALKVELKEKEFKVLVSKKFR